MKMMPFEEFCKTSNLKLTHLRKDILAILFKKAPLSAYSILDQLRKKRPNAEPPTVYRVLEWLVNAQIVHKIESENSFVLCSNVTSPSHKTFLLLCKQCHKSYEFDDPKMKDCMKKFVKRFHIE